MKVSELLQAEVWSRRTSRNIVVGFGVVVAVFAAMFSSWYVVGSFWLTPGERKNSEVALVRIDDLQHVNGVSDQEFVVRMKQANRAVEIARESAWTARGNKTASDLDTYFLLTVFERIAVRKRELSLQKQDPLPEMYRRLKEGVPSLRGDTKSSISARLHRALD